MEVKNKTDFRFSKRTLLASGINRYFWIFLSTVLYFELIETFTGFLSAARCNFFTFAVMVALKSDVCRSRGIARKILSTLARVVNLRIPENCEKWKCLENLKIEKKNRNFLKISKLKRKIEISWKSQNLKEKLKREIEISWKSENWKEKSKFTKFLENLKIEKKNRNFLKISKLKRKIEICWKSQNWKEKSKFIKFLENLKN